jgi:hypothetical protein
VQSPISCFLYVVFFKVTINSLVQCFKELCRVFSGEFYLGLFHKKILSDKDTLKRVEAFALNQKKMLFFCIKYTP